MKAHWKLLFVIVAIAMLLLPLGLRASEPVKAWAAHEQRLTAVEKELADAKARIAAMEKAALEKAATALAAPPAACPCPGAAAPATTAPAAAAGSRPGFSWKFLDGVGYGWVHESVTAATTGATAPAAAPVAYPTSAPVILRGQTCSGGVCYGGR